MVVASTLRVVSRSSSSSIPLRVTSFRGSTPSLPRPNLTSDPTGSKLVRSFSVLRTTTSSFNTSHIFSPCIFSPLSAKRFVGDRAVYARSEINVFSVPLQHFSTAGFSSFVESNGRKEENVNTIKTMMSIDRMSPLSTASAQKLSKMDMFKTYGVGFLLYSSAVYMFTGILCYASVVIASKGFDFQMINLIKLIPYIDKVIDLETINPLAGDVAVAVVMNEIVSAPLFPIIVATTPRVVNSFKEWKTKEKKIL